MASSSVFDLTRFTALASGDVIPAVDISNATQNAHGSLLSITVLDRCSQSIPLGYVATVDSCSLADDAGSASIPLPLVFYKIPFVGVTLRTVRHVLQSSVRRLFDWLKVARVAATRCLADVVQVQSIGNRPDEQFIGHAMGADRLTVYVDGSIARHVQAAIPQPTLCSNITYNLAEKASFYRDVLHSGYSTPLLAWGQV